jgi:hypothetical protein
VQLHSCELLGGRNATNAARCRLLTTHLRACGVRPLFSRIDEMTTYHMLVWRASSWSFFASLLCRLRSDLACRAGGKGFFTRCDDSTPSMKMLHI